MNRTTYRATLTDPTGAILGTVDKYAHNSAKDAAYALVRDLKRGAYTIEHKLITRNDAGAMLIPLTSDRTGETLTVKIERIEP